MKEKETEKAGMAYRTPKINVIAVAPTSGLLADSYGDSQTGGGYNNDPEEG